MAQNIGKKRGKSSIKARLEQERKAGRKDPKGKKSVVSKAAIASLVIPGGAAVKAGAKAVKAGAKAVKAGKAAKKADAARKKAKARDKARKLDAIERVGTKLDNELGPMTLSMKKAILRELKKGKSAINFKAGGKVKKTKSHRGDGIAKRGRTRGRIV